MLNIGKKWFHGVLTGAYNDGNRTYAVLFEDFEITEDGERDIRESTAHEILLVCDGENGERGLEMRFDDYLHQHFFYEDGLFDPNRFAHDHDRVAQDGVVNADVHHVREMLEECKNSLLI